MRLLSFGAVGFLAACVHLGVATALVEIAGCTPMPANAMAYCAALATSWIGQSRLTFAGQPRGGLAPLRFVATSLAGFALNALGYGALLRWTSLDYRLALLLVLAAVAGATWLALRHWVFARPGRGYA